MKVILIVWLLTVSVQLSRQQCSPATCQEPNCRCMSRKPPGGLEVQDIPQMVILTFDGAMTTNEIGYYIDLIEGKGLLNPNGCQISMTFLINHENNEYNITNYVYNRGHEIGTHSLSHTTPTNLWGTFNLSTWKAEIGGMISAANSYANIPQNVIKGQKCPFLQCNGDMTVDAMKDKGLQYDASFPTSVFTDPPIWPYTMDFGLQHDCAFPPCPTGGHPGIWTFPLIALNDQHGQFCYQTECIRPTNQQETFEYLRDNFNRHFTSNRAPLILSQTRTVWFDSAPYIFPGFIQFLQYLNDFEEVYVVPFSKALEWMKNPLPRLTAGDPGGPFSCPRPSQQSCPVKICTYNDATGEPSPEGGYRGGNKFVSCSTNCPDRFPWTCNPKGIDPRPADCDEGALDV